MGSGPDLRMAARRRDTGRRRGGRLLGSLLVAVAFIAGAAAPAAAETVRVFAAASTADALADIARRYEARTGDKVVTVFAASSLLARQIEAGAPADVFVSANRGWIDYLADRALIDGRRLRVVAGNTLVLVAPAGDGATVAIGPGFALAARLGEHRLALADPAHVPAGIYARQALERLGVWSALADRIAVAGDARAALALVERGEAPFGIVYGSDAAATRRVQVVGTFPEDSHDPIVYWAAPVGGPGGLGGDAAARFLAYIGSGEAAAAFRRRGFLPGAGRAAP